MGKNRLEAFSDGVIAIIITIMVLEMKVPAGDTLASLQPLIPVFVSYVLSFVFVGIYWNNHHHLLHAVRHVNGPVLWANMHFLFWLSLVPLVTGWMGANHFSAVPVAVYGVILLMTGAASAILVQVLLRHHSGDSALAQALSGNVKTRVSLLAYLAAIALTFVHAWLALGLYFAVAAMWIVPSRRIERALRD